MRYTTRSIGRRGRAEGCGSRRCTERCSGVALVALMEREKRRESLARCGWRGATTGSFVYKRTHRCALRWLCAAGCCGRAVRGERRLALCFRGAARRQRATKRRCAKFSEETSRAGTQRTDVLNFTHRIVLRWLRAAGWCARDLRGERRLELCFQGSREGGDGTGHSARIAALEGAHLFSPTCCLTAHPYSHPLPNQ
jgi:hypothetical protein